MSMSESLSVSDADSTNTSSSSSSAPTIPRTSAVDQAIILKCLQKIVTTAKTSLTEQQMFEMVATSSGLLCKRHVTVVEVKRVVTTARTRKSRVKQQEEVIKNLQTEYDEAKQEILEKHGRRKTRKSKDVVEEELSTLTPVAIRTLSDLTNIKLAALEAFDTYRINKKQKHQKKYQAKQSSTSASPSCTSTCSSTSSSNSTTDLTGSDVETESDETDKENVSSTVSPAAAILAALSDPEIKKKGLPRKMLIFQSSGAVRAVNRMAETRETKHDQFIDFMTKHLTEVKANQDRFIDLYELDIHHRHGQ